MTVQTSMSAAQQAQPKAPEILANDTKGNEIAVKTSDLTNFELELLKEFTLKDTPDEIIAFAWGRQADLLIPQLGIPLDSLTIAVRDGRGELRFYESDCTQRYFYGNMEAQEFAAVHQFIADNKIETLPERGSIREERPNGYATVEVGGSQYLYLRTNANHGRRLLINNPPVFEDEPDIPPNDPVWGYRRVVDFFAKLIADREKLQVQYTFPRPIDGLQVVYVPPFDKQVTAVWSQSGEVCVTLEHKWDYDAQTEHYVIRDGKLAEKVTGPHKSAHTVSLDGIKLRQARTSGDSRWMIGNRADTDELLCYDHQRKEFIAIVDEEMRTRCQPLYYLEPHKVFLLGRFRASLIRKMIDGEVHFNEYDLAVLDPATGRSVPLKSLIDVLGFTESELWFQNLPEKLQPVQANKQLAWVAIPSKNATCIGKFDIGKLQWENWENIPNLTFQTKECWVSESEASVYIVYHGHLLRVPLSAKMFDE